MGLKKLAEKVAEYNERLEHGKASEIKKSHVEKVLAKLGKKAVELEAEIAETKRGDKKARLKRKLDIAREQIARAEWLMKDLN